MLLINSGLLKGNKSFWLKGSLNDLWNLIEGSSSAMSSNMQFKTFTQINEKILKSVVLCHFLI